MDSITQRLLDQACFDELPDDLPTWHIGRLAYPDDPGQQAGFIDYLAKGIERGKLEACDHSFLPSDEQPGVLKATCIGGDEDYRRYESTESVPRCTYKALRTFLEQYPYQSTPLGPYIARWLRADQNEPVDSITKKKSMETDTEQRRREWKETAEAIKAERKEKGLRSARNKTELAQFVIERLGIDRNPDTVRRYL